MSTARTSIPVHKADIGSGDPILRICSEACSDDQASEIFRAAYAGDRAVDVRLLSHIREHTQWLSRGLAVLVRHSSGTRLVAGLNSLMTSDSAPVRAQAALLLARARPNAVWGREMLKDPDARVRANVVEGARSWCNDRGFVADALRDQHPRVVCNAVTLLYRLDAAEALAILHQLANSLDSAFRASAAWACGFLSDPSTYLLVRQLRTDPDPGVRWNALRALTALHRRGVEDLEDM
ncbi:MAG TPA: HEAT repeat domain-containing protein [Bryobacteraceae bacterium]|nr:HEAT repeat domain-containing protein [Bryobacteraceae bacterium]